MTKNSNTRDLLLQPEAGKNLNSKDLAAPESGDQTQGREEDGDHEEEDEYEYDGTDDFIITFFPLIELMKSEVSKATAASPPPSPLPAFQTHWRNVFNSIRALAKADPKIEEYITRPPLRHLEIELLDVARPDLGSKCPCCLPDLDADECLVIDHPVGISADLLLEKVGGLLYRAESVEEVAAEEEALGERSGEDDAEGDKRTESTSSSKSLWREDKIKLYRTNSASLRGDLIFEDFNMMMQGAGEERCLYSHQCHRIWMECRVAKAD